MKTECSIVRDLLPLYFENLLSEETAQYVKEHLSVCPECREEYERLQKDEWISPSEKDSALIQESAKPFKKVMKRLHIQFYSVAYAAVIFLIFLGFGWSGGENLLYNSLIMPLVGCLGYYVFRWKAVYKLPILLLLIDLMIAAFRLIEIDLTSALLWTLLYSGFALVGIAIAFLLHVAFGKGDNQV